MTTASTSESTAYAVPSDSRKLAMLGHLSAFITFIGLPSLLGPLAVWLFNRDDPFVEDQAKEALNFNISFLIYGVVSALAIVLLVGLIALPAVLITWFVLVILASVKAANGEYYRYPLTIRFVN